MKTFKDMTEKIRKGSEKDYIVIMTNKAGKEFKRLDYPTEKAARAARPKKKGQTASLPPEECSVDSLLSSVRAGNFKLKKTKAPQ